MGTLTIAQYLSSHCNEKEAIRSRAVFLRLRVSTLSSRRVSERKSSSLAGLQTVTKQCGMTNSGVEELRDEPASSVFRRIGAAGDFGTPLSG